jgi:hypothetical protein
MGTLIWRFNPGVELPNGTYTMHVELEDKAGNRSSEQISFEGGALLPEVVGFIPPDGAIVNFVDRVSAIYLDNSGSGIDTLRSDLTLQDPNSILIPETNRSWSGDTLTIFVNPASLTLDGLYTLTASPYSNDTLIPPGNPRQSTFTYDTQLPIVLSFIPITGDTIDTLDPFPTYVQANVEDPLILTLSGFGTFRIKEDKSHPTIPLNSPGSGIDFSRSTIGLISPSGSMAGTQSDDGASYIRFTPTTGFIEDGLYTITVELYDIAGNRTDTTSGFFLNYDLQLNPIVLSTDPFDSEDVNNRILTTISARLAFSDSLSTMSTISLADSSVLPVVKSNFGDTLLVDSLLAEPDSGLYTITVIARRTGPPLLADTHFATFTYSPLPPLVVSTTPADGDTVTSVISSVSALLQDSDGALSTITLKDPSDSVVAGTTNVFGDTLVYFLNATPSQPGQYMIVTVANRAGLFSTTDTAIFVYNPPDIIPPILTVDPLPDTTTLSIITVTGSSELNSTVNVLVISAGTTFVLMDSTDSVSTAFTFVDVPLDTGLNVFTFTATDSVGNFSQPLVDSVYRALPAAFKVFIALPFNQNTYNFSVDLPQPAEELNIAVYNTGGDFIWGDTRANLPVGLNSIPWQRNGLALVNNAGDEVGNGLYIYVVQAKLLGGGEERVKKLLMVLR